MTITFAGIKIADQAAAGGVQPATPTTTNALSNKLLLYASVALLLWVLHVGSTLSELILKQQAQVSGIHTEIKRQFQRRVRELREELADEGT